jgi:ABC-2 type transport system permease protein
MPLLERIITSFSPLTYLVDLMKYSLQGVNYYPTLLNLAVLIAFTIIFSIAGIKLQEKTLPARFS